MNGSLPTRRGTVIEQGGVWFVLTEEGVWAKPSLSLGGAPPVPGRYRVIAAPRPLRPRTFSDGHGRLWHLYWLMRGAV